MSEKIIYDKAKYHIEGDFPEDLDEKQAYVLTGFFVTWLSLNELFSDLIITDYKEKFDNLKNKEISPSDFYKAIGGVFSEDMLTQEGNLFTQQYFDFDNGQYLDDYDYLLSEKLPSFFHVADTWENYEIISTKINSRFIGWEKNRKKES
ncbi:MAG: hypothetical protein DRH26_06695 [Deltaproteobacteria bacterium]|nr:MAG: hypothetical protein DRH26_06695 [Deltaproteobacteria bacterium]